MITKTKLTFFDKLMLVVTLLAAVLLIMGTLAGRFDPREHIMMAFSGLAYPYTLLGNILLILWWVFRKKWIFVFAIFTVIMVGKGTLNATFQFSGNSETSENRDSVLRIMTYNVHSFMAFDSLRTIDAKRKMLAVIKEQQPDVICLQEFFTRFRGEFDQVDSISTILKAPYFYFAPASENRHEAMGLAIFSKYPIRDKGYVGLDKVFGGNGSIWIDIDVMGKPVRVYNLHLRSISFKRQDYKYMDKISEIKPDKKSSKRIYHMLRDAFEKRAAHVEAMKTELGKCTKPYIVAGDFNDTPASYAVTQLTGHLNNAFKEQGKGMGCTYNGKFPNFQIDYIACTDALDVLTYKITEAKLSDHFPVRADLKFK